MASVTTGIAKSQYGIAMLTEADVYLTNVTAGKDATVTEMQNADGEYVGVAIQATGDVPGKGTANFEIKTASATSLAIGETIALGAPIFGSLAGTYIITGVSNTETRLGIMTGSISFIEQPATA